MRHSQRSEEGYLLIDHRASPGTQQIPEGKLYESATFTCSHCSKVTIIPPDRIRVKHYCTNCDRYVCDSCAKLGDCNPIDRLLEAAGGSPEKLFKELQRRGLA